MPHGIYLDHAATAPVDEEALAATVEQMRRGGNPSSLHGAGRSARQAVETARESLAAALGCDSAEVVLVSGGTEADNLAVKGLYWKRRAQDPARRRVAVSAIEHHAVRDSVLWLKRTQGAVLHWIEPDAEGFVRPEALERELAAHPGEFALAAVMWANNEVGTVEPVAELAGVAAAHGVPFHTDAVQAFGAVPVDFRASGATTLAVSGHKIGAPMGVGALVATRTAPIEPLVHGGGQERDVRSGTIDAPAAVGFGVAARKAAAALGTESARVAALRDRLVAGVRQAVPEAVLRGPAALDTAHRLPGNAHFTFPGCEGDSLLFLLDMAGLHTSTGSACNAGVPRPSPVLLAMGLSEEEARGAQRFTIGRGTTAEDVDALLAALPGAVERARAAGLANRATEGRWS